MIINKNSLGALGFFLPPLDKLACRHGVEGEAGCVKADTALFSPPWPSLGGGLVLAGAMPRGAWRLRSVLYL